MNTIASESHTVNVTAFLMNRMMSSIKTIENVATVLCMLATIDISFFAATANFMLVFSLFLASSLILAVTTYLSANYSIMRLQIFFIAMNSIALVKEVI
ncbi:MAG: hypothetical protein R8M45_04310 [Ghiorsea sp.]